MRVGEKVSLNELFDYFMAIRNKFREFRGKIELIVVNANNSTMGLVEWDGSEYVVGVKQNVKEIHKCRSNNKNEIKQTLFRFFGKELYVAYVIMYLDADTEI